MAGSSVRVMVGVEAYSVVKVEPRLVAHSALSAPVATLW